MKQGLLSDHIDGLDRHVLVTIGDNTELSFKREWGMRLRKSSETSELFPVAFLARLSCAQENQFCKETLHKDFFDLWLAVTPVAIGAMSAWRTGATGSGQ